MKVALESKISATITWIAGVVAVAVACALPATFFVSSYWLQKAVIDTEAEINARLASQVINANPTLWRFQQQKFEEFLQRRPHQGDHEIRRIVNLEGKMIAESADPITAPWLWRSRDILDAGVKVGEIQIGRSLRPLVYQTAGVGLVAAALGLCAFVAIRVLPLRALNRALAENTKLVQETKRAEEVQKFLKELSQDIASLNIDSLLRKLTEKVREFFKADVADVRIIEKGVWKVKGVSGIEPEKVQSDSTGTSRGRSGWIIQNRQPLLVPDIIKQMGFSGGESIRKAGIRGYVGVPLFSRVGEVIGILRVLSYEPREFGESEVDLLQQLANGAAIALTNARLYDETERRRREAEELARVARSLTATLDMGAVGERIVTSVRELFGVKASTLRLLQPDGSLRALASAGEAFSTRSGEDVLVTGTGLASVAVAEGRPIWSADVLNEPRIRLTDQMRDYQLRSGDRSMMAVPLRAHETIIGSLGLADGTGRIYSDSEVALAQTFADQAALALENARLFEETEQRAQEQAGLSVIATAVSQSLQLDEILKTTLDKVLEVTGRKRVSIRLKNPVTGEVTLSAHRGFSQEEIKDLRRKLPHRASEQVFASGEALIIDASAVGAELGSLLPQSRSVAWIPIKARVSVVGVMGISATEPIPFSPREVAFLEAIGNVIGVAVANARLFEDVTVSKRELEKANNSLALQTNDLERSNAELEQFAYVASHDLQEPLRMVTGYTQLLAKRYGDKLDQNANEYIDYAVEGAKRMQRLIHDLLDFSRIGTRGKKFVPADCQAIVTETLRILQPAIQESGANITYDSLPTVMGDESQLLQLFQNLIGNAMKYRDSKPPVVQVSCKQESEHWLFSVRDNGIGIDPQYANRIFVIFQRLHARDEYPGTGIGLAVCKKIVERHGGKIWVESKLGKGATFYFTMAAAAVDGRASDVGE
jgi:signal transduction histidine kinase